MGFRLDFYFFLSLYVEGRGVFLFLLCRRVVVGFVLIRDDLE